MEGDEEKQLHSVALQTAASIFKARQRAEDELVRIRRAFEMLRLSMAQMAAASKPHDLTKVLELITNSLVEHAGMDGCMISLWLTDERCPICRNRPTSRGMTGGPPMLHSQTYVGGGSEAFLRHHRLPSGYGTVGYVVKKREPLLINDLMTISRQRLADPAAVLRFDGMEMHEADNRWVIENGFESTAAYPLITGGDQIVGALTVVAKRQIGDVEFAHLGVFAHQATVSIRSAQMLEELAGLRDRLLVENAYLQTEIETEGGFDEMIGGSAALATVRRLVAQVAPIDSTVLVLGETGTGKELVARAIHRLSSRRERPLIKVNCATIPPNLAESELFGHERGAFTGAVQRRIGRFELANNGTLFLDEIGELPLDVQVKLLRVLQEQEFERVGGNQTIRVDVRVVAATSRDLDAEVAAGRFRSELYYRINILPIRLPPLRDRREDIPLLVDYFLKRLTPRLGKSVAGVSQGSMQRLQAYHWPGNIRELQNVLERATVLAPGSVVEVPDMQPTQLLDTPRPGSPQTLAENEKDHIRRVLEQSHGRIDGPRGAARILGLKASTLRSRMQKLGLLQAK